MCRHCPKKRLADETPRHTGTQGIPDNLSVEEVFVSSTVEPPFIRRNVGDIADPNLAGRTGRELLVRLSATGRVCVESVVALNFLFCLHRIPSFFLILLIRNTPTLTRR